MRIISQDGTADSPYEEVTLFIDSRTRYPISIIYANFFDIGFYAPLGEYETRERALEVMAEIRQNYLSSKTVPELEYFYMPIDDDEVNSET